MTFVECIYDVAGRAKLADDAARFPDCLAYLYPIESDAVMIRLLRLDSDLVDLIANVGKKVEGYDFEAFEVMRTVTLAALEEQESRNLGPVSTTCG